MIENAVPPHTVIGSRHQVDQRAADDIKHSDSQGDGRKRGARLTRQLLSFATQPQFVYRHTWAEGDLIVVLQSGAYGLTEENFRTSIRLGWGLISRMRAGDLDIGTTECSSCKLQMEQGTTTPTVHPLKLMASPTRDPQFSRQRSGKATSRPYKSCSVPT